MRRPIREAPRRRGLRSYRPPLRSGRTVDPGANQGASIEVWLVDESGLLSDTITSRSVPTQAPRVRRARATLALPPCDAAVQLADGSYVKQMVIGTLLASWRRW